MKTVITHASGTSNLSILLNNSYGVVSKEIVHTFNNSDMKTFIRKYRLFAITFVIANLFIVNNIVGQITQPKAWTKGYDQASGTATGTSFAIASGSNRILIVAIATTSTSSGTVNDPTTISYGGVTLTKATSNGGTNGRPHTFLYYLKDNSVMDNTSRALNVTMGTGTIVNLTVWYAVYAGVNQAPGTYTTGNNLNNSSGSGPAALSAAMTVNANEQGIYISNIQNDGSTAIPGYTINTNWTSGGSNTGTSGTQAWKDEVAKRTIPGSNTTDNAVTSTITPSGSIRYAMSAMSLPMAIILTPTITSFSPTNACSGSGQSVIITGTNYTGATSVTFNGVVSSFTVNNATQITATLPAGATTGKILVTTPSGSVTSLTDFTVYNPTVTVSAHTNVSCYAGTDGTITILAGGGTAPYQFSVDNGVNYTTGSNPNPYVYPGLSAGVAYKIRIIDTNGCQSPAIN